MKILIPTDFSVTADKSLQYAVDCFSKSTTIFILYHAFMPFESGFYSYEKSGEENTLTESALKERLKQKADKIVVDNPGAKIKVVVDRGTAERGILRYAAENNIDLIIMGTTGATGIKASLIGSVTADVMSKSGCPVIGVPEKYKPRLLKEIAFCSNYQLRDVDALKFIRRMLKKFQAEIQIWHFHEKAGTTVAADKLASDYKSMVKKIFRDKSISFHFSETDNIQNALSLLAASMELDMIGLITHQRKGFLSKLLNQSLTRSVAYHTHIPLLSIPAGQN